LVAAKLIAVTKSSSDVDAERRCGSNKYTVHGTRRAFLIRPSNTSEHLASEAELAVGIATVSLNHKLQDTLVEIVLVETMLIKNAFRRHEFRSY
jgi:hypothetical protein